VSDLSSSLTYPELQRIVTDPRFTGGQLSRLSVLLTVSTAATGIASFAFSFIMTVTPLLIFATFVFANAGCLFICLRVRDRYLRSVISLNNIMHRLAPVYYEFSINPSLSHLFESFLRTRQISNHDFCLVAYSLYVELQPTVPSNAVNDETIDSAQLNIA